MPKLLTSYSWCIGNGPSPTALTSFYTLARPGQMGAGWRTAFPRLDTPPVLINRWPQVLLMQCLSCAWHCVKNWASARMEKRGGGGHKRQGTNFKEVSRLCSSQDLNIIPCALPISVSHPFILTSTPPPPPL